ncbi:MAG: hypothetical protein QOE97_3636 [Pseudonocardiales bacterium]|nr:hypothetical protein [Pseudonocardiales bacterium]
MSVEPTGTAPGKGAVATGPPPRTPAEVSRERYVAGLRRGRIGYAAVLAAVVVATLIVVKVAYSSGEISHATLRTVAHPPAAAPLQTISPVPVQAWSSADAAAIGTPVWGGTVVTWSDHTVRGRDASTGAVTWSYTRTDRTVCQAIQDQGVTIAVFRLNGNCDELTAVDSQTGQRRWTRTLDKDGNPVNGEPTYSVGAFTVLVTTPDVIYALDPGGGLDRWTYAPPSCRIASAVLGSEGALISQTCTPQTACTGLKFCGAGPQLLLRDATAGRSDEDKDKANPDQIKWDLLGNTSVPVSADQLISAADPRTNQLQVLDKTKGSALGMLQLAGSAPTPAAISRLATTRAELIWVGGVAYSVELTGADLFWRTVAIGPPTATAKGGDASAPVDLNDAVLLVPTQQGVDAVNGGTGTPSAQYPVPSPRPGSSAYPYGSGFVVAGPGSPTVVYR